ncbi:hypothetical protein HU200_062222 [Digitaria exilis]|uniref:WAT1-related protein n=1 Tax=Digitaria exilis TaxID=1010633 RepID=A0A835E013_9POAL|nr:hypothetical protein HU200_062222 [Digitaria exilis]
MSVISKAAFDAGMSTFVFVFYRQAAGSILIIPRRKNAWSMPFPWLLKLFMCALVGLSLYNVSLKLTSATVAAAASNSMAVVTFCLALLLRMEVVKLRSASGVAKLAGVALCLAGVFAIAFYSGPTRIEGTFLMILANVAWSVSIVWQVTSCLFQCQRLLLSFFASAIREL